MTNAEEDLRDPTEETPTTSSFPRPVAPPPVSGGRRGANFSEYDEDDEYELTNRLIFVELSSFVLIFSVVSLSSWYGLTWYAFSVGLVSFLFCIGLRVLDRVKPEALGMAVSRNSDPRLPRETSLLELVTSFLFFWWVVGAFFLTFYGPFTETSNGYFSAWVGLISTVMWIKPSRKSLAQDGARAIQTMEGRKKALNGLLGSSIVVLLASIKYARIPEGAFGLALGAVSMIVAVVLLMVDRENLVPNVRRGICVFLGLMWLAGAGVLTFYGPFKKTGNGYFGAWLGMLCTLWYAMFDWEKL